MARLVYYIFTDGLYYLNSFFIFFFLFLNRHNKSVEKVIFLNLMHNQDKSCPVSDPLSIYIQNFYRRSSSIALSHFHSINAP